MGPITMNEPRGAACLRVARVSSGPGRSWGKVGGQLSVRRESQGPRGGIKSQAEERTHELCKQPSHSLKGHFGTLGSSSIGERQRPKDTKG